METDAGEQLLQLPCGASYKESIMHPDNAALYRQIDIYAEALKTIRDKKTDDASWCARLALLRGREGIITTLEAADGKKKV